MNRAFQRQQALIDALQAVAAVRIRSELHIYTSSIPRGASSLPGSWKLDQLPFSPHTVRMILGRGSRPAHRGGDFVEPLIRRLTQKQQLLSIVLAGRYE